VARATYAAAQKQDGFLQIPGKVVGGERERCIAAGASEYISKPVDTDQLVSMMRVWLGRV